MTAMRAAERWQWAKIAVASVGAGCLSSGAVLQAAKRPWPVEDIVLALIFGLGNACIASMLGGTQKPKDKQIAEDLVDVAKEELAYKASVARQRSEMGLPERRTRP